MTRMQPGSVAPDGRLRRAFERAGILRRMIAVLLAVGLVAAIAACSSSKAKSGSSTGTSTISPTSTGAATSSGATSSGAPSGGSAVDIAAIKYAYLTFFDPNTSLEKSLSLLQDGAEFRDTVNTQGNSTFAKEASVTVSKVVVTSASKASVTFSVLLNKSPVLPNQTGYAVRESGVWKVAGVTFCGLLAAQGTPPPVCSKPAATSTPS